MPNARWSIHRSKKSGGTSTNSGSATPKVGSLERGQFAEQLKGLAESMPEAADSALRQGLEQLAERQSGRSEAADALPAHLGLCYDVCHAAVEYEDPAQSIADLRNAGVPVHIHKSAFLPI